SGEERMRAYRITDSATRYPPSASRCGTRERFEETSPLGGPAQKRRAGSGDPALETDTRITKPNLPGNPDAEPSDARSHDLADVVRDRRVLRALLCQHRVRGEDVEQIHRRRNPRRSELDRTLDVEVEVLEVRQAVLADAVEQDRRDARTVDAVRRLHERFEDVALPRVVERRHVHVVRQVVQ